VHDDATIVPSDPDALLSGAPVVELDGDVHAWSWPLSGPPEMLQRAYALLDDTERARAARFVKPEHRDRFVTAHAVMRALLARYANCTPGALRFVASAAGKPSLAEASLHFNLSHSAGRAVLAIGRMVVGVDVEHHRARLDPLGLASRYFFGAEHDAIRDAPPHERIATFLRYWVAKEAVLKAQGVGLAFPLDAFSIVFAADARTARVTSQDPGRLSPAWRLRMMSLAPGWPVAVAAAGDGWSVRACGLPADRANPTKT
jgi:4'-phosphopantetheinyl transferase